MPTTAQVVLRGWQVVLFEPLRLTKGLILWSGRRVPKPVFTQGGQITRDAANPAGFANPDSDTVRHGATSCTLALGNWGETDGAGRRALVGRRRTAVVRRHACGTTGGRADRIVAAEATRGPSSDEFTRQAPAVSVAPQRVTIRACVWSKLATRTAS
jgi:hypothetical protein